MEYPLASLTSPGLFDQHEVVTPALSSSAQAPPKRNRTQLSCTQCRHAKLKCDRQKPSCSQCVKKGRASLCTFLSPAARRKPTVSMQNRLKHLEGLVKNVMTGQNLVNDKERYSRGLDTLATTNGNPMPDVAPNNKEAGAMSSGSSDKVLLGSTESTYVGATHWAAILEDIDEIKSYLNEELDEDDEDEKLKSYTSLIFNAQSPTSKAELLATLPQRQMVDLLVSRYFNSNSPALHILHGPTFQRNYRKFWADPEGTPIIFLGLLYSTMIIATCAALGAGEETPQNDGSPTEMIRTYRECCVQCLVLSNYTKPGPYTLETLFIYMESEFLLNKDDQVQSFLLVGNATRLALRMGLHRDSTKVGGNITPFQGEMRRRLWHHLLQIDLLSSFHIGLPGMIPTVESDTLLPSNLRDEEFGEDSAELPPSRPDSEITPASYMICKSRLCQEAGKIVALANRLSLPEYVEIMRLDSLLETAYQKVPPAFRLDSAGPSITDSPSVTIKRFSIAMLYQKGRCMLHRKHLMRAEKNPDFGFSKRAGLDAAMEILRYQSMIHEAALPGGLLSRDRWFLSSLSMHDFLLAAMIVYLHLFRGGRKTHTNSQLTKEQKERIIALEKSRAIWNETWSNSAESKKASVVLSIMLNKVHSKIRAELSPSYPACAPEETRLGRLSSLSLNSQSVLHCQDVDSLLPTGSWVPGATENVTPSSGLEMPLGFDFDSAEMGPLGAMFDVPNDFDWEMFDNQLLPRDVTEQNWPDLMEDFSVGNNDYYNV